jgi:hypothetical protein
VLLFSSVLGPGVRSDGRTQQYLGCTQFLCVRNVLEVATLSENDVDDDDDDDDYYYYYYY